MLCKIQSINDETCLTALAHHSCEFDRLFEKVLSCEFDRLFEKVLYVHDNVILQR